MSNIHLKSISSTNDYLKELSDRMPLPDWSCVKADFQKKGRGQRGSEWLSESGKNLLVSFWIRPTSIASFSSFDLNRMVCLAILRLLEKYGLEKVSIKWPNDILVGRNKIAGVLIENSLSVKSVETSVIGIGLNVNQNSFQGFPATSMVNRTQRIWDIEEINSDLLAQLKASYTELLEDVQEFRKNYLENLYGRHTPVKFIHEGKEYLGLVRKVSLEGRIGIENNGLLNYFGFKEIEFILGA